MGLRLVDDYSGEDLDRDHEATTVRIGMQGWNLYLTDASKEALFDALKPFTDSAEPVDYTPRTRTAAKTASGRASTQKEKYGYEDREVRAWAIANKVKNEKKDGTSSPVGERAPMSQNVYDAYHAAQQ